MKKSLITVETSNDAVNSMYNLHITLDNKKDPARTILIAVPIAYIFGIIDPEVTHYTVKEVKIVK